MRHFDIWKDNTLFIDGYKLLNITAACPEKWEVYDSHDHRVGYLRLRHGYFAAYCNPSWDVLVYETNTIGDGCFDYDERLAHLTAAVKAINGYIYR